MKYYSLITGFFILSFLAIISLLYFANITRNLEKENLVLVNDIKYINDQININEIEFNLYTSYDYLKKMQKIYFEESDTFNSEYFLKDNRVTFNKFINDYNKDLYTVGMK
jgi:hypothetical protein